MKKNDSRRRVYVIWALAAGLIIAAVAVAQVLTRPKTSEHLIRFAASPAEPVAAARYEGILYDLTRETQQTIDIREPEVVEAGDPAILGVRVDLAYYRSYQFKVRGVGGNGVPGQWSEISDVYEHRPPWDTAPTTGGTQQ